MLFFLFFPLKFQNIAGLAVQNIADGLQSGETDGTDNEIYNGMFAEKHSEGNEKCLPVFDISREVGYNETVSTKHIPLA
jgi:hypothetical protein